jgi:hypothetical protein
MDARQKLHGDFFTSVLWRFKSRCLFYQSVEKSTSEQISRRTADARRFRSPWTRTSAGCYDVSCRRMTVVFFFGGTCVRFHVALIVGGLVTARRILDLSHARARITASCRHFRTGKLDATVPRTWKTRLTCVCPTRDGPYRILFRCSSCAEMRLENPYDSHYPYARTYGCVT